ncbi:Transcriptional regulatory protein DevR (DosR) [Pseudonocardia autotrophica]|nr:Transcriptional regulatory protein DevR (DosR) [Pseudonocardia autotrophica]
MPTDVLEFRRRAGTDMAEEQLQPIRTAVLIDDHPLVLEGLARAVERQRIKVVATFTDPERAVGFLLSGEPRPEAVDLVVVDLRIGERSGLDLLRTLQASRPDLRTVILTSYEDRAAASEAVRAGARGFLLKDVVSGELCGNLRSVADGNLVIDDRVAGALLDPSRARFTDHELSILRLVAEGCTNREIGMRLHLSAHTVKDYLSRTMRKLGTTTRAETVVRASQEGWLGDV